MTDKTPGIDDSARRVVDLAPRKVERERSTIEFPYSDLDEALAVTKAVHAVGGRRATMDQIAPRLGHDTTKSGAFRTKLHAARVFGLVRTERDDVVLTPLGQKACDPKLEAQAKVDAFLTVPLYRAIYDQHRGVALPASEGLESFIVEQGVARKQKDKARHAFQRSAKQAGMFGEGKDRLVIPPAGRLAAAGDQPPPNDPPPAENPDLHPFVQGLLRELPAPGTRWNAKGRKKWLTTAESIFDLIYGEVDEETSP